jgi:uncharacterized membrane protein YqjE
VAAPQAPPDVGPIAALRALGGTLLELVGTRAELAVVELREEAERRREMLVLALAGSVCLGIGLVLASLFVVVLFWDDHRLVALGGVTLVYFIAGGAAFLALRRKSRASPPPFEATLAEFERDRDILRGLGE